MGPRGELILLKISSPFYFRSSRFHVRLPFFIIVRKEAAYQYWNIFSLQNRFGI
ncbi:hypothetical protein MGA3_00105 [Bacillus methanolicus MGA3]|nr:hypothetical protein MGA3_00105 [Bacillus methanolicus MGA3]